MKNDDGNHNILNSSWALLLLPSLLWVGCTAKVPGVSPSDKAVSAEITLTRFQSQDISTVATGSNAEYITGNPTLTFEGTCPANTPTVRAKFNGVDAGVGAPCNNQTFVWAKTNPAAPNQIVTVEFYIASISGAPISGPTLTKKLFVDTLAPTAPTALTVNGTQVSVGSTYVVTTPDGSVTIEGSVSSNDAKNYTSTDLVGSFSAKSTGGFTFNTVVASGETRTVTISILDTWGNSAPVTVILSYNSSSISTSPYMIQNPAMAMANANLNSGSNTLARASSDQYGSQTKASGSYTMEVGTTNVFKQVE